MYHVRRLHRICFRTTNGYRGEIERLCELTSLPRSAMVFLLTAAMAQELGSVATKDGFWLVMAQLPFEIQSLALLQERGEPV